MYSKRDNIEVMINVEEDESIKELLHIKMIWNQ